MRNLDFSSWNGLLSTLLGLVLVSLVAVGIRLVVMQAIQRRQQRENRQINERLKTLIAAYKTLGGSFTGDLRVDPVHLRELRRRAAEAGEALDEAASDRPRRMRDAVEAALSDIVLLGTEEQVRLAAQAASDMVAGRPVQTAALVVSLRDFIRAGWTWSRCRPASPSPSRGRCGSPAVQAGRAAARARARVMADSPAARVAAAWAVPAAWAPGWAWAWGWATMAAMTDTSRAVPPAPRLRPRRPPLSRRRARPTG